MTAFNLGPRTFRTIPVGVFVGTELAFVTEAPRTVSGFRLVISVDDQRKIDAWFADGHAVTARDLDALGANYFVFNGGETWDRSATLTTGGSNLRRDLALAQMPALEAWASNYLSVCVSMLIEMGATIDGLIEAAYLELLGRPSDALGRAGMHALLSQRQGLEMSALNRIFLSDEFSAQKTTLGELKGVTFQRMLKVVRFFKAPNHQVEPLRSFAGFGLTTSKHLSASYTFGAGWWDEETDEVQTFRWMSASSALCFKTTDACALRVELERAHCDRGNYGLLARTVGATLVKQTHEAATRSSTFEIRCSSDTTDWVLELVSDVSFVPAAEPNGTADQRTLSVCVSRIVIERVEFGSLSRPARQSNGPADRAA